MDDLFFCEGMNIKTNKDMCLECKGFKNCEKYKVKL